MDIKIVEETSSALEDYAKIPTKVFVDGCLNIEEVGKGDHRFSIGSVTQPYEKNYDDDGGSNILTWQLLWNIDNWGFLSAYCDHQLLGSAVIAYDTDGVNMLENRSDLAVLWDLRVHPDFQCRSVGSKLFDAACHWAMNRGCRAVKIETQNTNIRACHFYRKNGCSLRDYTHGVYPKYPEEVQMIWVRGLMENAEL